MKVKELIYILNKFNPDDEIIISTLDYQSDDFIANKKQLSFADISKNDKKVVEILLT